MKRLVVIALALFFGVAFLAQGMAQKATEKAKEAGRAAKEETTKAGQTGKEKAKEAGQTAKEKTKGGQKRQLRKR
jgi:Ni/Co efflux regulator RcnB